MQGKHKRFGSLLAMFVMLAAVVVMAFSSTSQAAAKRVTVKLDANGGTVSPNSRKVTVGDTYGVLPTPTRTGYKFVGWYTKKSGGSRVEFDTRVTKAQNHTLYAHWTAKKYTVTFDAAGGKVDKLSKSVTYDSAYGYLPFPRRKGYTFMGWYTRSNGLGKLVHSGTTVTTAAAHTLHAKWKPNLIINEMEEFKLK